MIKQTSMAAYLAIKCDGTINRLESLVVSALSDSKKLTRQQICYITRLQINSVCGRVHSLLKKGIIIVDGEVLSQSGRKNEVLRLNDKFIKH